MNLSSPLEKSIIIVYIKGGCPQESHREYPPHSIPMCDNNNSDHHRDGDPSLNIIRTQPLGIQKYINSNFRRHPLLLFL